MVIFGEVIIWKGDNELGRIGQGEIFGEMAVLEEAPRMATAEAAKPTLLFSVGREILVDSLPSLGFKVASHLAKDLSKKLRDSTKDIEDPLPEGVIR